MSSMTASSGQQADVSLADACSALARQVRAASFELAAARGDVKNGWLEQVAQALVKRQDELLTANALDQKAAPAYGLSPAALDRLRLTPERLQAVVHGVRAVAALPDPIGRILEGSVRPNGLQVSKVSVPLGVIFFIYESRPNVTIDAATLCIKSGNALILRGGKEAFHSNQALGQLLQDCLEEVGLPRTAIQTVPFQDRAAVGHLLRLPQYIDLVIPRGGASLIRRVVEEAQMPVMKHFMGNCHVYVDRAADLAMAERIIVNAKCQRPGVCNAAESLLVHRDIALDFVPRLAALLGEHAVEIRGCARSQALASSVKPATEEDYAAEYLDLIISLKVVDSLEEAIAHIQKFGSQHTEAIVTNDLAAAKRFTSAVDAAAVLVNASTRFNDGFELGLGAEIGISTDKIHARGPCGLLELCSYKYVIWGEGRVRSS
jgi:glutamate-5-semialdehyde dehydrogenase